MPMYEFECPKGHVTERIAVIGTARINCETCNKIATRVLSATRTTFQFADERGRRKRQRALLKE